MSSIQTEKEERHSLTVGPDQQVKSHFKSKLFDQPQKNSVLLMLCQTQAMMLKLRHSCSVTALASHPLHATKHITCSLLCDVTEPAAAKSQ